MKNETSSVVFHLPDSIADGIEYTDIQVIVQMGAPTHDTANLADAAASREKGTPMSKASKNQKLLVGLEGGSEEGYMNAKSLLEWTKGRGSTVTAHSLDLALGNLTNNPKPGQRIHFHAQPRQQDRSVVQGKPNHAFNQEEPKVANQEREYIGGRKNHAWTPPPEEAQKKVARCRPGCMARNYSNSTTRLGHAESASPP